VAEAACLKPHLRKRSEESDHKRTGNEPDDVPERVELYVTIDIRRLRRVETKTGAPRRDLFDHSGRGLRRSDTRQSGAFESRRDEKYSRDDHQQRDHVSEHESMALDDSR